MFWIGVAGACVCYLTLRALSSRRVTVRLANAPPGAVAALWLALAAAIALVDRAGMPFVVLLLLLFGSLAAALVSLRWRDLRAER